MTATIALVDDDRNILTSVSIALQAEGFLTRVYSDGETALKALVDEKIAGEGGKVKPVPEEPANRPTNVVDLMAALKSSLEKAPPKAANDERAPAAPKAAANARASKAKAEPARKRARSWARGSTPTPDRRPGTGA